MDEEIEVEIASTCTLITVQKEHLADWAAAGSIADDVDALTELATRKTERFAERLSGAWEVKC